MICYTVKKVYVSLGSTYYMVEYLEKILFLLAEALKTVFFHRSGKPVINKNWNHNYFNACRFQKHQIHCILANGDTVIFDIVI